MYLEDLSQGDEIITRDELLSINGGTNQPTQLLTNESNGTTDYATD